MKFPRIHPARRLTILFAVFSMSGCSSDTPVFDTPVSLGEEGLRAHYNFNGGVNDSGPNGHHGALLGNATADGSLVIGSNNTDALSLRAAVVDGMSNFAFATWVRMDAFHLLPNQLISGSTAAEDDNFGIRYESGGDRWALVLLGETFRLPVNSTVEDMQWHHIAITTLGGVLFQKGVQLYVDGVAIEPVVPVSYFSALAVDAGGLIISQDQANVGGGFQEFSSLAGEVDELRIYDRSLDAGIVSFLYSKGH